MHEIADDDGFSDPCLPCYKATFTSIHEFCKKIFELYSICSGYQNIKVGHIHFILELSDQISPRFELSLLEVDIAIKDFDLIGIGHKELPNLCADVL